MSARDFEAFLARIYVDPSARAAFKASPRIEASRAGLSEEECIALENTDWSGLEMSARIFAHKRRSKLARSHPWLFLRRARRFILDSWDWLRFNQ